MEIYFELSELGDIDKLSEYWPFVAVDDFPKINSAAFAATASVVTGEDLIPTPYDQDSETVSFLDFDFEYLAGPRGMFLFVGGQILAQLREKAESPL